MDLVLCERTDADIHTITSGVGFFPDYDWRAAQAAAQQLCNVGVLECTGPTLESEGVYYRLP